MVRSRAESNQPDLRRMRGKAAMIELVLGRDAATTPPGRDARRVLQLLLAATWVLDGLLQYQSFIYTDAFGPMLGGTEAFGQILAGGARGSPPTGRRSDRPGSRQPRSEIRMSTPAWILGIFAAIMILVAEVSAGQLVIARAWTRRGGADADIAISQVLMVIAMAGILVPGLSP